MARTIPTKIISAAVQHLPEVQKLGINYYLLKRMLSLEKHMPEEIYKKLSSFVKFEFDSSA